MNDEIFLKYYSDNVEKELENIDFSSEYISHAKDKFYPVKLKIFNLKSPAANILKQTCLSLGFDAAVARDVITCKCEKSDVILTATISQLHKLSEKLKLQPFGLKNLAEKLDNFLNFPSDYKISDKSFDFKKSYIMGILNVTPDSFSDGGKNFDCDTAVNSALKMLDDGADIIDIGGESTRPDATPVSPSEEIERVIPVIKKIKSANPSAIISIDTVHSETAVAAINAGADILNNVGDVELFKSVYPFLSGHGVPVVITHSVSVPPQPVDKDYEGDIVDYLCKFFVEKINYLKNNGLTDNLFILDVGIGFGKSVNDQFEIIKRAEEFIPLGYPVLFGISRKSFLSKTFGQDNRDDATVVFDQYLMQKGVNILRVHDVSALQKVRNYLSKIL